MKIKNRILVLLFTVVLTVSSIIFPVNASASTTSISGEPGSVVTFEYKYHEYAGIEGPFTFSNPEMFSKIEILVPGLMGEYNPSTQKLAYFGMTNTDITVKVVLTISENATPGTKSTIDFSYRLATQKGEVTSFENEPTITITVVPKLDYTRLIQLIKQAQSLKANEYTAKSWAALETALAAAIKAQDAKTQAEINNAANALEKAINELVKLQPPSLDDLNFTELELQISRAEALKEKDYTESSWSNMKRALNVAVAARNSTKQSEIDSAAKSLKAAIDALVKKSTSTSVDYTALNRQIAIAESLNERDYTPESWSVLNSAYLAAISARSSDSQNTVDKATNALEKAIQNLVPISKPIDYTELNKQITIAKGLDESKYTSSSFAKLTEALKAGELALSATTQEEVDKATEDLRNAIAALIELKLDELLAAIDSVKNHISSEKLAQLYKELFELWATVDDVLASGDQDRINELALKLRTYLDAINKELEALKKAEVVEVEKVVEVPPTDDYCNIPSHRIYIVLFWVSFVLNLGLIALIAIYLIKKSKTGDDTPIVDYDIADDTDISDVTAIPMVTDIPDDIDTPDEVDVPEETDIPEDTDITEDAE